MAMGAVTRAGAGKHSCRMSIRTTRSTMCIRCIIDVTARAACTPSMESMPPAVAMGAAREPLRSERAAPAGEDHNRTV